jgi:hypothetical protein
MDLTDVTEEQLCLAVERLNHRPRKVLGFRTPHEVFLGVEMCYTKPPLAVALLNPRSEVIKPENWTAIAAGCALMSDVGHFAQVAFASVNQPFAGKGETPVPLWRGHGVYVRYFGLESGN